MYLFTEYAQCILEKVATICDALQLETARRRGANRSRQSFWVLITRQTVRQPTKLQRNRSMRRGRVIDDRTNFAGLFFAEAIFHRLVIRVVGTTDQETARVSQKPVLHFSRLRIKVHHSCAVMQT